MKLKELSQLRREFLQNQLVFQSFRLPYEKMDQFQQIRYNTLVDRQNEITHTTWPYIVKLAKALGSRDYPEDVRLWIDVLSEKGCYLNPQNDLSYKLSLLSLEMDLG